MKYKNTKYKNTKHKLQYTLASGRWSGDFNVLARLYRLFGKQTVLPCLPMVHTLYNAIMTMLPFTMYNLHGRKLPFYQVQCKMYVYKTQTIDMVALVATATVKPVSIAET